MASKREMLQHQASGEVIVYDPSTGLITPLLHYSEQDADLRDYHCEEEPDEDFDLEEWYVLR